MFNEKFAAENELLMFIKMAIKNTDFALISVDYILNTETIDRNVYEDEHTFYFYYIQNLLAACGNLSNIFNSKLGFVRRIGRTSNIISPAERSKELRGLCNLNLKEFPLIFQKEARNTNMHFDERYDEFNRQLGDYNILDENTPYDMRNEILNTPHLRTYDKQDQVYITIGCNGNRIEYPLKQLRQELAALKLLLNKSLK